MISRIFSFVFNRTTLVLMGLIAISLIIWFIGPWSRSAPSCRWSRKPCG